MRGAKRGIQYINNKQGSVMPKQKTKKGAAKRFRITKTGKVKSAKSFTGHLLTGKSSKRKRSLSRDNVLGKRQGTAIKKTMPYG